MNPTVVADVAAAGSHHGPTFWQHLFFFLNNIVDSITNAVLGFLEVFHGCFADYIDFELDMTRAIIGMDHVQTFVMLTTIIVLLNSVFFWVYMIVKAVLPYGHHRFKPKGAARTDEEFYDKLL